MSFRASASRYARALLAVAAQESDVARVGAELQEFADLMAGNPELGRALLAPGVPNHARASVVRAIAEKAGFADPLRKTLVLLAERGRLELLPDVAIVYRERLLAHQNIVPAQVASAVPLSAEQTAALAAGLSKATGGNVQVSASVDPALIGGLVARVGSTVYDGSIRTQLQKMKQQLIEQA